jgi:hypothetical protein
MVTTSADKTFDLYLAIIALSQENPNEPAKTKIILDYEKLPQYFGTLQEGKLKAYKHAVNKELTKVEQKYKLIKLNKKYGENPEIELLASEASKQDMIALPRTYWEYSINKNLGLTSKFMCLISLYETRISPEKPWWTMTQDEIADKYGVKRWTVYTGSKELKEQNILEIEYARTSKDNKGDFAVRPPNRYKLNDLISETEREQTFNTLKDEYGETNFNEAKSMAGDLDEPNDPLVIETLLDLIKIYGLDKVKAAVAIPAGYKADNSMKHIRYVIGILQKE